MSAARSTCPPCARDKQHALVPWSRLSTALTSPPFRVSRARAVVVYLQSACSVRTSKTRSACPPRAQRTLRALLRVRAIANLSLCCACVCVSAKRARVRVSESALRLRFHASIAHAARVRASFCLTLTRAHSFARASTCQRTHVWELAPKDIKGYEKDIQGYIGFERFFKDFLCEIGYEFRPYPKQDIQIRYP